VRIISERQRLLQFYQSPPSVTQEWNMIASILEANSSVTERVWEDLRTRPDGGQKRPVGAKGMTAEQVLRFAVVMMKEQLTYRDLHDRVADSISLRAFCLAGPGAVPAFTTLQENIKRIRPETWEAINKIILGYACARGIEDGSRVRIDTTGIETDIHHPTDSHQLWDSVRVLTRILQRVETQIERLRGYFHDHRRVAKKMFYRIHNTRAKELRKPLYRKLIGAAQHTLDDGCAALDELTPERCASFEEQLVAAHYAAQLEHFLPLAQAVIEQSRHRVLQGQDVPAQEKVLSIFEPHTDIIKKGQRDIVYGHKVLLTGGKSNLILDTLIEHGNPADAANFLPALDRQQQQYGRQPKQVATDAGFASKNNARQALDRGIEDVAFVAPKHKTLPELIKHTRAYKKLCNWRAGIEGIISAGKRAFGLDRCTWSGYESFKAYVHLAVLAFNLQTLARHLLA
jgi:IS5 family transposase